MKGNIILGAAGAAIGAISGAIVWAVISIYAQYQIGFMAIGVGVLVGFLVRKFGQGREASFGVVASVFAVLGCLLGNVLTGIGSMANEAKIPYADAYLGFDVTAVPELLMAMFSPIDLLFYAIAIQAAYRYAKVPEEMAPASQPDSADPA
jgi:hypothetical protein